MNNDPETTPTVHDDIERMTDSDKLTEILRHARYQSGVAQRLEQSIAALTPIAEQLAAGGIGGLLGLGRRG